MGAATRPVVIATKADPALWAKARSEACARAGLCQHSARKMQWVTRYYKAHGGRYANRKRSASNALARWSRQRWRTHSGRRSDGVRRYLPADDWAALSRDQVRRTDRAKARGHAAGRQWVAQPPDVRRTLARHRKKKSS